VRWGLGVEGCVERVSGEGGLGLLKCREGKVLRIGMEGCTNWGAERDVRRACIR